MIVLWTFVEHARRSIVEHGQNSPQAVAAVDLLKNIFELLQISEALDAARTAQEQGQSTGGSGPAGQAKGKEKETVKIKKVRLTTKPSTKRSGGTRKPAH